MKPLTLHELNYIRSKITRYGNAVMISDELFERLIAAIELAKQVEEYGKVMIHVVPGEHGEGEEVPATPESIRGLLKELQREWDNAERRIAELQKLSCLRPIADAPRDGTFIAGRDVCGNWIVCSWLGSEVDGAWVDGKGYGQHLEEFIPIPGEGVG